MHGVGVGFDGTFLRRFPLSFLTLDAVGMVARGSGSAIVVVILTGALGVLASSKKQACSRCTCRNEI
jgi:hypothetical protein